MALYSLIGNRRKFTRLSCNRKLLYRDSVLKKELFDGKLHDPIGFVVANTIISVLWISIGVFLICVIIFGNNTFADKVAMGIVAVAGIIFGTGYPILFVHVVKNRKKYPRLSKLLVKPGYWVDKKVK